MNLNINNIAASMAGFGAGVIFFFLALVLIMLVVAILAWIPIVRYYTFGKVYDDINEKQGKRTSFGIILLIINCVYWSLSFLSRSRDLTFLAGYSSWGLYIALLVLKLICFNLIFKKYAPNNSNYFILTIIFSIIPIVPFIPGLCLLKASKNQPISEIKC